MLRRVKLLAKKLNQKYQMLLQVRKYSDDTRKNMSAAQSTSQAIEVTDLRSVFFSLVKTKNRLKKPRLLIIQ